MITKLASSLALLTSCSAFMSGPPSPPNPKVMPDCTPDRSKPMVDLIVAAATGTIGVGFFAQPLDCSDGPCDTFEQGLFRFYGSIFIVHSVVFGLSAAIGFPKVNGCRDAIRAHERWRAKQPAPS